MSPSHLSVKQSTRWSNLEQKYKTELKEIGYIDEDKAADLIEKLEKEAPEFALKVLEDLYKKKWDFFSWGGKKYPSHLAPQVLAAKDVNPVVILKEMYFKFGRLLVSSAERMASVRYFKRAIELGSTNALYHLGCLYLRGAWNFSKDEKEAFKYFKLLADQQDPDGQAMLGELYYSGAGVEKDFEEAVKNFKLAAKKNNPSALYHLGLSYESGLGVPKSEKQASDYYDLAMQQDDTNIRVAAIEHGTLLANRSLLKYRSPFYPKITYRFQLRLNKCNEDVAKQHCGQLQAQADRIYNFVNRTADSMRTVPDEFMSFVQERLSNETSDKLKSEFKNWNYLLSDALSAPPAKEEHRSMLQFLVGYLHYVMYLDACRSFKLDSREKKSQELKEKKEKHQSLYKQAWLQVFSLQNLELPSSIVPMILQMLESFYHYPRDFGVLSPSQLKLKSLHLAFQGKENKSLRDFLYDRTEKMNVASAFATNVRINYVDYFLAIRDLMRNTLEEYRHELSERKLEPSLYLSNEYVVAFSNLLSGKITEERQLPALYNFIIKYIENSKFQAVLRQMKQSTNSVDIDLAKLLDGMVEIFKYLSQAQLQFKAEIIDMKIGRSVRVAIKRGTIFAMQTTKTCTSAASNNVSETQLDSKSEVAPLQTP